MKLSSRQKRIARAAPPFGRITGADFRKLKRKKNAKKKKKSSVNKSGNYTKPGLRKRIFNRILAANIQGTAAGKWSGRKAQLLAKRYKKAGGGYK